MTAETVAGLRKRLHAAIRRRLAQRRDKLVPPAYTDLWQPRRYSVWYGGRDAAKSWSIARVLLVLAAEAPLRILICREIQGSLKESAYKLLCDQIRKLELHDVYDIMADRIVGKNGSEFFFEGLRFNIGKIRSYEGINIVWIEEAQMVSDRSWEDLLPTIREPGSRIIISYNPVTPEDPVYVRFVKLPREDVIVHKVTWRDNPHHSAESEAERVWLEKTDNDAYMHVWEGEPRTVSDALILRGKFTSEQFDVQPSWSGPHHGMDFGFASDPSAALRCYIDDTTRALYVSHEFWQLGCDIDALPAALEGAIPGVSRHVVYCDSARPETVSYLARNGIANARSAEKWPGSVDDGIAYLRSFSQIIIDPRCQHLLDECRRYSFKTDRLTGAPLPEPEDKHNHCVDALRYALSPLIRNKAAGGSYFSRAALLVKGEPLAIPRPAAEGLPDGLAVIAAVTEQPGSAVAFIYFAVNLRMGWPLTILDWDIVEIEELTETRLAAVFARAQALRELTGAGKVDTPIIAEPGLHEALLVVAERLIRQYTLPGGARLCDLRALDPKKLPL
jgi:phage terminase large subunit